MTGITVMAKQTQQCRFNSSLGGTIYCFQHFCQKLLPTNKKQMFTDSNILAVKDVQLQFFWFKHCGKPHSEFL